MNSRLMCRVRAPLGIATVALLVAATAYGQYAAGVRGWLLAVELVLGVAGIALLPWLFRRPVRAALVLAVLAGVAPTVTPVSTVGTLHVATRERLPVAIGVALAGSATHALRGLWLPMPGLTYGWWLVLTVACHAALVAMGALSQTRHALIGSLRERAERAEAEQGRLVAEARAAERAAIAREMHDVLAHRLSLVATYAGALEYRPDHPPERLSAAAGVIRDGVHQALEELRDVITLLHEEDSAESDRPVPALTDLPMLVAESRAIGTPVEVRDVRGAPAEPAGPTGRTAYRVVQEALTNARKHAPGEPVRIDLDGEPGDRLLIDVCNPLPRVPASAIPGAGRGLVGLTERVRLAGGQLDHRATATEFRLSAWLPWPA